MATYEASLVAHDAGHGHENGHEHDGIETFIADNGVSQIHTFFGDSNTELILGFSGITKFSHGHHARSGGGRDVFHFMNLDQVQGFIVGRLEDFDYSRDKIVIEGVTLDLNKLPQNVKILSFNGSHNDPDAEPQQWLSIKTRTGEIFYALEGARIDMTGNGGANHGDQEAHFITAPVDTSKLKPVAFNDPMNVVPAHYQPDGGIVINDDDVVSADVVRVIRGTVAGDLIAGGLNNDTIAAGDGADRVWGGSGSDKIYAENGSDSLFGNTGNDTIFGGDGDDRIQGNSGNDILSGGQGNDVLMGGDGADKLDGGDGDDSLYGGNGNDVFNGRAGNDVIFGYGGADLIYGLSGNDAIKAGQENDRVFGGLGDDSITGQTGDDVILGDSGRDKIYGDFGSDYLYGGADDDFVFGGADSDNLYGGAGNDFLGGGNGADLVFGGEGSDQLQGGYGADRFIFSNVSDSGITPTTRDTILDFQRGQDKVHLSLIDADSKSAGDQSFHFIGARTFDGSDEHGDLRIVDIKGGVLVVMDVDGDGIADMSVMVNNVTSLTINDFIL